MMESLKDLRDDSDKAEYLLKEWIGDVAQELKAAVRAGKIGEEEAWKRWKGTTRV